MSTKAQRLADVVHMLNLLPYFEAHPGRSVMEAAKDLGRSPQEIMEDLNSLWCCGLPGLFPGDLVEMDFSYAAVNVSNSQGLDQPLRLTPTEAGALLLALESLDKQPGLTHRAAVESAATKLRSIMGEYTSAVVDSIIEDTAEQEDSPALNALRQAMEQGQMLGFTYYSARSDTSTRREVHPTRVFSINAEAYLAAWEDNAEAHRTFKVDRMSDVEVLQQASNPHTDQLHFDAGDPFAFSKEPQHASLLLHPEAAWLADFLPMELEKTTPAQPGKWIPATMPVGSTEWLARFVVSQADRVRLIGPAEMVDAVAAHAEAGLGGYAVGK